MTDYETQYISWNETPGLLPVNRPNWLAAISPEPHPQVDALAGTETIEDKPRFPTSPTMAGLIEGHYAEAEEDED